MTTSLHHLRCVERQELTVTESVPIWQTMLAIGGVLLVIGGLVGLQLWSQARRNRGEEASESNASGAEVFFDANFPTGT